MRHVLIRVIVPVTARQARHLTRTGKWPLAPVGFYLSTSYTRAVERAALSYAPTVGLGLIRDLRGEILSSRSPPGNFPGLVGHRSHVAHITRCGYETVARCCRGARGKPQGLVSRAMTLPTDQDLRSIPPKPLLRLTSSAHSRRRMRRWESHIAHCLYLNGTSSEAARLLCAADLGRVILICPFRKRGGCTFG